MKRKKIYETIETQLPEGYRLATADDADVRNFTVVLEHGLQILLITSAPDSLVDAMDDIFNSPATGCTEQRTANSLGLA